MNVVDMFKNAVFLDIETLGLDTGAPIHEISIFDKGKRSAIEWIPNPLKLEAQDTTADPLRKNIFKRKRYRNWAEAAQEHINSPKGSWTKKMMGTYHHLQNKVANKFYRDTSADFDQIPVIGKANRDMSSVLNDVFGKLNNRVVFIANAPFESRQFGAQLKAHNAANKFRSNFTYSPESMAELLYVNDPGYLAAKSKALAINDWSGVWDAINNMNFKTRGTKVIDPLDIIRAAQSIGFDMLNHYKIKTDLKDLSTGVGIDVQARLLGLPREIHKATEDNILTSKIVDKTINNISNFRRMKARLNTATGTGLSAANAAELDSLNWMYRMHLFKTQSAPVYLQATIARAMMDFEEGRSHDMSIGYKDISVRQRHNNRVINTLAPVPQMSTFNNLDELIRFLKTSKRGQGVDIDSIAQEVNRQLGSDKQANNRILNTINESSEERISKILDNISNAVAPQDWLSVKTNKIASTKFMKKGFGAALIGTAALAGVGILNSLFDNYQNTYNQFSAFQEEGLAARERDRQTDFGSPYQGFWQSASYEFLNAGILTEPSYANNILVNQQITDFKNQQYSTPLQKQILKAQLEREEIKSFDKLYFLNPELLTPYASKPGIHALTKTNKLMELDLRKVNWSVEDADTLILKTDRDRILGRQMEIRLAGIDAPEIMHKNEALERIRFNQEQPYGKEGSEILRRMLLNASNAKVLVSPTQDTYGRSLGVIIADNKNINLELVRHGAAAALPFGESSNDLVSRSSIAAAESAAYKNQQGMWASEYWKAYYQTLKPNNRLTNNTLARLDKLAENTNYAQLASIMEQSQLQNTTEPFSNNLRLLSSKLNKKYKKFEEEKDFVVDYKNKQQHLDQLKFETSSHMKNYGSQISEQRMRVAGHQYGNIDYAVDSLSRSNSIYQSKLNYTVKSYYDKMQKRKLQQKLQHQANQVMNHENNGHMRM